MNKGLKYERDLFEIYKKLDMVPVGFIPAGSSSSGNDLELRLNGQDLGIEIKLNQKAQMGGTSIKLNHDSLSPKRPFIGQDRVIEDILEKKAEYEEFLRFFDKESIPFVTYLSKWNLAKDQGLLAACNIQTPFEGFDFVKEHYKNKGTNYLQIGGSGLFSLNHVNPFNAPTFDADIELITRFVRGSAKFIKNEPEKVCSVSLRVQAKLTKTYVSSLVNLENPETILKAIKK